MTTLFIFILFVTWIFCPIIDGIAEAYLWRANAPNPMSDKQNKYIHSMFLFQRSAWWISTGIAAYFITDHIWVTIFFMLACGLVFPFFHLGAMYETRYNLDHSYPEGFFSNPSETSKSRMNITYQQRLIAALIGCAILAYVLAYTGFN